MGNSASDISSSGMYVQVLQYVKCALAYNFMELWCVEIHHITKIGSHHTKKVVSSTSRFHKKGNISRTENQKCSNAILFWLFMLESSHTTSILRTRVLPRIPYVRFSHHGQWRGEYYLRLGALQQYGIGFLVSLPLLERGDKPYVLEVSPDVRFPQRAAAVTRSFNLQPHRTAAERCS